MRPASIIKFTANSKPADVFTEDSIDRYIRRKETSDYYAILAVSSPKAVYNHLASIQSWDSKYMLQFVANKSSKTYIREQCEDILEGKYYPSEKQRWGIAFEFISNKESVKDWVNMKIKEDLKFQVEDAAAGGESWQHPFLRVRQKPL